MYIMLLTLDVSKLSGWLNADADCAESRRQGIYSAGRGADRGGREGGARAIAVQAARRKGSTAGLGSRHGEERTPNMPYMFVTLDVSKLSRWLNADAYCRESKGGHTVRVGGLEAAMRRRAAGVNAARRGGLDCRLGAVNGEERTSNMDAIFVTRDVSKLSGWLNADAW
eukprot:scaffold62657_cov64-Phaeocystis_antarctica.AAC.8